MTSIYKLGWERFLCRIGCSTLILDEFKLGRPSWNNPGKRLSKVLVELLEVFFKSLLFLLVKLIQELGNALFRALKSLSLSSQLMVLLQVLLIPLLAMPVLSWELIKLLARLVDQLLQLTLFELL